MKKSIFILFILLFATSLASAEPILLLNQDKFQPGETLIGEIKIESGEFSSQILESNIKFYEGRRETLLNFELFLYNNTYYFYAYFSREGNFTLKIQDILYKDVEGIIKSTTIEKNLYIKENPEIIQEQITQSGNITYINKSYTKILSVRPGVLFTSSNPELIFENKGNTAFNISFKLNNQNIKKTLYPNRPEKVSFQASSPFSKLELFSYNSFSVPIIYIGKFSENNTAFIKNLRTDHSIFQIKSKPNIKISDKLELFNFANNTIFNLKINKNLDLISISSYETTILGGGSKSINFSFYSEKQGFFKDNITITFEENKTKGKIIIPVEIYIFSENTSINKINLSLENRGTLNCSEKGGQVCIGVCEGLDTMASDGYCCFGNCIPDTSNNSSSSSSFGWLWGIIIFLVLGTGGYFIYKKVKSTKSKPASAIITDKTKDFEKRISGGVSRS